MANVIYIIRHGALGLAKGALACILHASCMQHHTLKILPAELLTFALECITLCLVRSL